MHQTATLRAIPGNVRQLPTRWRAVVGERFEIDEADPIAKALAKAANDLETEIAAAEDESRMVSVTEFAHARGVRPGTVRKWCARHLLAGAEKHISGDWMIPIGASRGRTIRRARGSASPIHPLGES